MSNAFFVYLRGPYEESSVVLGQDGQPVAPFEGDVDEREAWSEVMA